MTRSLACALLLAALLPALALAQDPNVRPTPVRPSAEEAKEDDPEAHEEKAPKDVRFATLAGFEGELAAPARAQRFLAGLHAAFASEVFVATRKGERPGSWKPAGRIRNRFRLHEDDVERETWRVSLVVDSLRAPVPPDSAAVRPPGVRVVIAIVSPRASDAGARPLPIREDLGFDPRALGGDFAGAAGRVVGLRALERLHQLAGELGDDGRLAWPGRH